MNEKVDIERLNLKHELRATTCIVLIVFFVQV